MNNTCLCVYENCPKRNQCLRGFIEQCDADVGNYADFSTVCNDANNYQYILSVKVDDGKVSMEKDLKEILDYEEPIGFVKLDKMNFKDDLGHPLINCEDYICIKKMYKELIDTIKICIDKFGKNSISSELLQIIVDLSEKML